MSNAVRTTFYLGILTALVVATAWLLGADLWAALGIAAVMNFSAYWFSDTLALKGAKAKPVTEQQMPEVYRIVRELTEQEGMPMPSIHRIKTKQANAFATGRNPRHAAVAVTDGIMDLLNERELRGVLGHELSHVKNRDILISSIAAVLGAALSFFISRAAWSGKDNSAWLLPAIIFTPIASLVLRSGISKTREFEADHDGGELTEDPLALASALERIEDSARRFPLPINAALGALFTSDPLLGFGGGALLNMMSTHPPWSAWHGWTHRRKNMGGTTNRRTPMTSPSAMTRAAACREAVGSVSEVSRRRVCGTATARTTRARATSPTAGAVAGAGTRRVLTHQIVPKTILSFTPTLNP